MRVLGHHIRQFCIRQILLFDILLTRATCYHPFNISNISSITACIKGVRKETAISKIQLGKNPKNLNLKDFVSIILGLKINAV